MKGEIRSTKRFPTLNTSQSSRGVLRPASYDSSQNSHEAAANCSCSRRCIALSFAGPRNSFGKLRTGSRNFENSFGKLRKCFAGLGYLFRCSTRWPKDLFETLIGTKEVASSNTRT